MRRLQISALVLGVTVLAAACFGESEATSDSDPATTTDEAASETDADTVTEDETDRPCEGGAFPDDDEFRELCSAPCSGPSSTWRGQAARSTRVG